MSDSPVTLTAPIPNPWTEPFYEAVAEGRFLVPECSACGKVHWYPRPQCPFCFGEVNWKPSAGTGEVYSFAINRTGPEPYVFAFVTLDEGPYMMTHVVDIPVDEVTVGQRVQVRFQTTADDGPPVPVFAPAG